MKMLAKLSQTVKNGFCHLIIKLSLYCFGVYYTKAVERHSRVCVCVGGGISVGRKSCKTYFEKIQLS